MASLTVPLGERSYEIEISRGFGQLQNSVSKVTTNKQLMIVSNKIVAPLYLEEVQDLLCSFNTATCLLEDGESFKDLKALEAVVSALLKARFDRGCTLVALGGGVVGDITGFAAASYQRGVKFIQIPTTLLAQVDSSVGGKTGVNHPLGKNMIGAFYQPQLVYTNTETLQTLPDRELRAGIAEVIKYGLISRADFFCWLEDHIDALLNREPDKLEYAIRVSCETKSQVVAADENESGIRAILNLGHTFGHAIETGLGYGEWLHGEAVACGMNLAARMSHLQGWISSADLERTTALLKRAGLPVEVPLELSPEEMLNHMQVDKKNRNGRIRLILLKEIGQAVISDEYELALLHAVLTDRTQQ